MKKPILHLFSFILLIIIVTVFIKANVNENRMPALVGTSKDGIWFATYTLDDTPALAKEGWWTGVLEKKVKGDYKITSIFFLEDDRVIAETTEKDVKQQYTEKNDIRHKYTEFVIFGAEPRKEHNYSLKVKWEYNGKKYEETIFLEEKIE